MSETDPVSEDSRPETDSFAEPLQRWERFSACLIGVAAGGAGTYAVFASANQAGTAVLLVVSVVFLLIGVQGTPLIRFASGSNAVELERRRRVRSALIQAAQEDNVDRAIGIIEGVAIAEPRLVPAGAIYERRLAAAIVRLGYRVTTGMSSFDFRVEDAENRSIFVESKYYGESHGTVYNVFVSGLLMKIGPPDDRGRFGRRVLLVSNARLSNTSRYLIESEPRFISFVIWRDESDDDALYGALAQALAES